jgi:hypothetical protein
MLKIRKFEASQVSPVFVTLTWYIENTTESLNDYHVDIYQSELPSASITDYSIVASGLSAQSSNVHYDYSISGLTNKYSTYNYIAQLVNNSNSNIVTTSTPISIQVVSDKYARHIIYHRELIFRLHSGQDFKILKRRTFGTLCTNCFDETLQTSTLAKCPVCYDTRYVGGYYTPYTVRGQLNEAPPRQTISTFGHWQDADAIFVTSNKPILIPGDVVVDRLGRRWNVLTVKSTNKALFTIAQQAQIRMIEIDNIVCSVPISW